ncbi:MAG: ComEA family DNA-binding protein [Pyrinomonadaceae bacterium]
MKQIGPATKVLRCRLALVTLATAVAISSCAKRPRQYVLERSSPVSAFVSKECININNAPAADLETLPGVGKVSAERIIAYRTTYGPFRRAEHLMMVRGISDRKFREMSQMVCVR